VEQQHEVGRRRGAPVEDETLVEERRPRARETERIDAAIAVLLAQRQTRGGAERLRAQERRVERVGGEGEAVAGEQLFRGEGGW